MTKDGWLYDKEAILKYIIEKREDYRRKQKAYEAQTNREFKELHKNAEKDLEKQKEYFEKQEQVRNHLLAFDIFKKSFYVLPPIPIISRIFAPRGSPSRRAVHPRPTRPRHLQNQRCLPIGFRTSRPRPTPRN